MLNKDPTKKILSFEVEDTGIGIEKHKLTTLFKAFGKLDDKVGLNKNGVGLGLMISKDIVEASGGQIKIESEFGVGTKFKFDMVVGILTNEGEEDQIEVKQGPQTSKKKVEEYKPTTGTQAQAKEKDLLQTGQRKKIEAQNSARQAIGSSKSINQLIDALANESSHKSREEMFALKSRDDQLGNIAVTPLRKQSSGSIKSFRANSQNSLQDNAESNKSKFFENENLLEYKLKLRLNKNNQSFFSINKQGFLQDSPSLILNELNDLSRVQSGVQNRTFF